MTDWKSEAEHWKARWANANRLVEERNRQIVKLCNHIGNLERAGHWSHEEEIDILLSMLEDKFPQWRVTHQRREIANLHKVIRRLKEQVSGQEGS